MEKKNSNLKMFGDERGYATLWVLSIIVVVIALGGLLIDGGRIMTEKIALTKATQAAAVAAVLNSYDEELWEESGRIRFNENDAKIYAASYLQKNISESYIEEAHVVEGTTNEYIVKSAVDVELVFMKVFHIDKSKVTAIVKGKLNE